MSLRQVLLVSLLSLPVLSLNSASALAQALKFTLKNQTSVPLVEFYVNPTAEDNWGDNILNKIVEPGESGVVTINDGARTCTYDILGVFADGDEVDERQLNLCELGSYTYTENEK